MEIEARRERIVEMAKLLLPCVEECRRKERLSKNILLFSCILFALAGGYLVRENTRPINSNEYAILSNLITLYAQESKDTPEAVSTALNTQFRIDHLQDLKARHWNDALNYLALKRKI